MYAQIPAEVSPRLMETLEEGKVFIFRKFLCNPSRPAFRVVDSPYMIQCTRYTTVALQQDLEDEYRYCTYNLVPFLDIPKPSANAPYFIDVIGQITAVSDVVPVQSLYQTQPSDTRTIVLQDLHGNEIKLTLWGARAREFESDEIHDISKTDPIITIFVGVLPKMLQGVKLLSGSSACRWYINEDLPDITSFHTSLGEEVTPVAVYTPISQGLASSRVRETPVEMTVQELLNLDPFENRNKPFICTVTINRLGFDQCWSFLSCGTCRKTAYVNGHQFRCSDRICTSVTADPVYCICTFANDGTAEAEFMFFEKVARVAVGKPLMTLLTQKYPGCTSIHEIAQMAGSEMPVPIEVSRMVAKKYRLVVTISRKSIAPTSHQLSFQVSRIEQTFKPELGPLAFGSPVTPFGPSSSGGSTSKAPFAIESALTLTPYTPLLTDVHASGSTPPVTQAIIDEMKTKAIPPTPSGKSPCPNTTRRKLLFTSSVKTTEDASVKTTEDAGVKNIVGPPLIAPSLPSSEAAPVETEQAPVDIDVLPTAPAKIPESALDKTTKPKRSFVHTSSLLCPWLFEPTSARASEEYFDVPGFICLSLHPFDHPATLLLICLQAN